MKINENFSVCEIAGEVFLMPVGNEVINVGAMISLNETSAFIIRQMKDKEVTMEELVEFVYAEYEADKKCIAVDIQDFINRGRELGFIIE